MYNEDEDEVVDEFATKVYEGPPQEVHNGCSRIMEWALHMLAQLKTQPPHAQHLRDTLTRVLRRARLNIEPELKAVAKWAGMQGVESQPARLEDDDHLMSVVHKGRKRKRRTSRQEK